MTFSSAVLCGKRLYCWNTIDTSLRSASLSASVLSRCTSKSATRIVPRSIGTSALMHRSSVDLPEPDGPMMQTTPPFGTSIDMPLSTATSPNDLCTSWRETIGRASESVIGTSSDVDRVSGLEADRPPCDRIAIDKKPDQHIAVER